MNRLATITLQVMLSVGLTAIAGAALYALTDFATKGVIA